MGRSAITGFDPVRLGRHENAAWVGYYRRDWRLVLRSALGMVSSGFGLSRAQSLRGAWYVLRANQAWAPYPQNDPDRARELMRRFYALLARAHDLPIEPRRAAVLEVDWWREHRVLQRETDTEAGTGTGTGTGTETGSDTGSDTAGDTAGKVDDSALVAALTALYSYLYDVPPDAVRPAAALRSRAMQLSDAWVARGCDPHDASLREQQRILVASYTALRQAVERPPG